MNGSEVFHSQAGRVFFYLDRSKRRAMSARQKLPFPLQPGQRCVCGQIAARGVGNFFRCRAEWFHGETHAMLLNPGDATGFQQEFESEFAVKLGVGDFNLKEVKLGCTDEVIIVRPRETNGEPSTVPFNRRYTFEAIRVGCPNCMPQPGEAPSESGVDSLLERIFGNRGANQAKPREEKIRISIEMSPGALGELLSQLLRSALNSGPNGSGRNGGSAPPFGNSPFGPSDDARWA